MGLALHIASGSRAGQRATFTQSVIVAGRHPDSELRFDAQRDLDVSTRHAEFRSDGDTWIVRDLGSTNGTFVNGRKISASTVLGVGDVVSLGAEGPRVEIIAIGAVDESALPRTELRSSQGTPRPSTQERVAIAVAKETGTLKRFVIGLAVVAIGGVALLAWMNQRAAADSRATIARLLAQSDSINALLQRTIASASDRQAGLDSLGRILQSERQALARALQRGGGNVDQITRDLSALDRRANQALALGGANYRAIADENTRAVASIVIEQPNGKPYAGTAFGISPGGLLVTNRHLILDDSGRAPNRIAVRFSGENNRYVAAHLVRVVNEHDLAFVQIANDGAYPAVKGIAPSTNVAAGDPVAAIGFPLANAMTGGTKHAGMFTGMVNKVITDTLLVDVYSAPGASGSPVFDARGYVIGVLFGTLTESGGRIITLVPSSALIAQLKPDERTLVR
jgi:S1-C subfamily serine protease